MVRKVNKTMRFLILYLSLTSFLLLGCVSHIPSPLEYVSHIPNPLEKKQSEKKCTISDLNSLAEEQLLKEFNETRKRLEELDETRERRIALVIGNGNYKFLEKLRAPLDDAEDMTDSLIKLGFSVICVLNATSEMMTKSLEEFEERLDKNTLALFYFSGHGGQNEKAESLLFPVDFNEDKEKKALKINKVVGGMNESGSSKKVIIVDACRKEEEFNKTSDIKQGLGGSNDFLAKEGFFVAYATAPGTTAAGANLDGCFDHNAEDANDTNLTKCHSLYTKHLLNSIFNTEPIHTVFETVRVSILEETPNQIPWESSSLKETLYLVPRRPYPYGGFQ